MMDPALQEILAVTPPDEVVEAVMLLQPGAEPPAPARPVARFGDVLTCRLPARAIVAVHDDDRVVSLKASRVVTASDAVAEAGGTPVVGDARDEALTVPATGRGVALAFLDWGCDFAHPNFRRADGSTRLLALWDQRHPARAGNRYGYGTIHGASEIDAALRAADPYAALGYHPAEALPRGLGGTHACHVMDIAAGSGRPRGIACDAALLFVHLAAHDDPLIGGLGDSVRLLEAIDFVRATAEGMPWVISMSLGRTGGDHTGRSIVERALDALLEEGPGRCVTMSAGNYYSRHLHASGWLRPAGVAALDWIVERRDPTPNEMELWYPGHDRFALELEAPGGERFRAELGGSVDVIVGGRAVGRFYHRACDPLTGDHHVDVFLTTRAPGGRWRLHLHGADVVDGRYHAWIERDLARAHAQSYFRHDQSSPRYTTGTIANGYRTISVGAVDTAGLKLPPFSSSGPSRDGRMKPDICAPGAHILAARSTPRGAAPGSGGLIEMSGTSMAAPHVAATAALMFEVAPRPLRIEETRALLLGSARPLDALDPLRAGAGLLDVAAAVSAAARMTNDELQPAGEIMANSDYPRPGVPYGDTGAAYSGGSFGEQAVTTGTARAETLFRRAQQGGMAGNVEILGLPGQPLTTQLRRGDILVRVAPGEPGLGRLSEIVDGALAAPASFAALGIIPEGMLPGQYAAVIENGDGRGSATIARRIVDGNGYLPQWQMVVRPTGGSLDRQRDDVSLGGGTREAFESSSATLEEDAGVVEIVGLGLAIFQAGQSVLSSGDFRVEAAESSYVHPNTPPDRQLTRSTMDLTIVAFHPRYFIDNQEFVFRVEFEHNGNDITLARISPLRDASSSLYASDFNIAFRPSAASQPADAMAKIRYVIEGRWNPVGRGDVSFRGELNIAADGSAICTIDSERQWVYVRPNAFSNVHRVALPTPRMQLSVFEIFFSPPGSDRINPGTERAALDWYDRLDAELRRNVENGTLPVTLHGYASTTGNDTQNRLLARHRAERVQAILRDRLGTNARIEIVAHGERDAGTRDETEVAAQRKVRIEIRRYVAPR
ncbi:MAG TPA: S8 family serine peptidase [Gemmatimonadaceae bacterium]